VDVTNTGNREGDEAPQLYVHPKVSSVTQPVMKLAGFERIALKPGEKKTVEFNVTPETLSILNTDMHRVVEPGVFEMMVGPSSDKVSTVLLTVSAQAETGRP
jgi:beta-glucosidase